MRPARAQAMNLPQLIFVAKLLQTIGHRVGMDWASMLVEIRPIAIAVDKMGERAYGAVARSLAAWAHAHLGQMNEAKAERDRALLLSRESGGRYMAADWFHASDAEIAYLDGRYRTLCPLHRRSSSHQVRSVCRYPGELRCGISPRRRHSWNTICRRRCGDDGKSARLCFG